MQCQLAPSILDADFAHLGDALRLLGEGGAHWLHLDVMDNHFVPNLTFGPPVARSLVAASPIPAEAHLMVTNPASLIEGFAQAGCKRIIVHPEGQHHLHRLLQSISGAGAEPAVVINPATPVCAIEEVLPLVSMVLVMSVNPGFGGQAFIPSVLAKVRYLAQRREELGLQLRIELDGGVNAKTLHTCRQAGADTFVVGSAIFRAADPAAALRDFVRLVEDGEKGAP